MTIEGTYAIDEAINYARLWEMGKLIGGDPYAVVSALLKAHDQLHETLEFATRAVELTAQLAKVGMQEPKT